MDINQITIVGTGLIGGSLGLALKDHGFPGRVVGCDKALVLAHAKSIGAIDLGIMDLNQAVHGSDVVVLATPVGAVLDLIEKVGPIVPENVLLTDVGSTKQEIVERAHAVFGAAAATRFLPGHPMAGKECGGIESADASLFEGAAWLVTPARSDERSGTAPIAEAWLEWLRRIGARVLVMDAARHDRLCAWISHLPQMIATALAATLKDEFGDDAELGEIGGRALREMTRIAASPYSMWRDIAFTNTRNIEEAISGLEQRLVHLRENLRTRGLQEEFEKANEFKKN